MVHGMVEVERGIDFDTGVIVDQRPIKGLWNSPLFRNSLYCILFKKIFKERILRSKQFHVAPINAVRKKLRLDKANPSSSTN